MFQNTREGDDSGHALLSSEVKLKGSGQLKRMRESGRERRKRCREERLREDHAMIATLCKMCYEKAKYRECP